PVDEGDYGNARSPYLRRLGDGHHAQISPVTAPHDRNFFRIEVAGLRDPVHAREYILQVAPAHIEQVGLLEFLAVAGRPAIVGGENHVSLVGGELNEAVERVHGLRIRATVNQDQGSILPISRHVEGHVEQGGDGPLPVAAGIVDEVRFNQIFRANSREQGVGDLVRLAGCQVVDPKVGGGGRAIVNV